MSTFLLRRIVLAIPVLFGILLVTFTLNRLIPGDPCRAVLGERATDAVCDAYLRRYGLDQPIPIQFVYYVRNITQGDLGTSLRFGRAVTDLLAERLPVTIELALTALVFATVVGIPMGILSAYRRNSSVDVGTMIFANIGVSMPVFWLGLMLAFLFGVILKDTPLVLPPSGRLTAGANPVPFYVMWGLAQDRQSATALMRFIAEFNMLNAILTLNPNLFFDAARHMLLPAVAVGTIPLAII